MTDVPAQREWDIFTALIVLQRLLKNLQATSTQWVVCELLSPPNTTSVMLPAIILGARS